MLKRLRVLALLAAVGLTAPIVLLAPRSSPVADAAPCDPPITNPILCENSKPGNPPSEWDISGSGSADIQGFATDISVNKGETIRFKIQTSATAYRLDIYRMGYYGGMGARKIATVRPSVPLPQNQPACRTDASVGLVDCGNWAESASWAVPADVVSGIYFAKLVREDGPAGASHIFFVVRDDNGRSDILFQTSDTTWQAYNRWGGASLYVDNRFGLPAGRAYKVSYNRPFNTRDCCPEDWVFNAEYPMVRWLEANGYNVSYFTGVDTDRRGAEILEHRIFMSVGHDEYWSGNQRANVETARNNGVHLAFFSGNEVFWKTRWENSIDGANTPYRTLVCYKETHAGAKIDPLPNVWTGTWRDPRFSPPADGGRPENGLTGQLFTVNGPRSDSIVVPAADGKMRFWRNTSIATLNPGQSATLPAGVLGYEWDEDIDNGFRPPGLFRMSTTTLSVPDKLQDYGSTYGPGQATHSLTLYRHSSGALVFGAGTVQWSWGLDSQHDRGPSTTDVRMQQAAVNLFADMGVQPGSLQAGLVVAAAATDTTPPISRILAPAAGASVTVSSTVTITGTAADTGGVVGGVEVSTDGGTTWRRATGRENWSYVWTPVVTGTYNIRSRAVDDSGRLEAPGSGITVSVVSGSADTTPPTISNVQATSITTSTATVNWTTNEPADSQVEYGPTTAYGSATAVNTALVLTHSQQIAGLSPGTTYNYRVKSKDAAGNLATSANFTFTTATTSSTECPCSLWPSSTVPTTPSSTDPNPVELGVRFTSNISGYITAIRFYKGQNNTGTHTVNLWTATGARLATATSTGETASGWQEVRFSSPVAINANTPYIASYHTTSGRYAIDANYFATARTNGPLTALASTSTAPNGIYLYSSTSGFPNQTWNASNYWVDVVFVKTVTDTTPPGVQAVSPAPNATGVSLATSVVVTFTEGIQESSLSFILRDPAGSAVSSTVTYSPTTFAATLKPASALGPGTTYTATVSGAKDLAGNTITQTVTWAFTTAAAADTTPPAISGVQAVSITTGTATISWSTNEPADSQVEYGTTTAYGSATAVDPTLVVSHSQQISGLSPATTYNYQVRSKDAAGNLATSANFTFTTAVTPSAGCPCSLWSSSTQPTFQSINDPNPVEVGVRFMSNISGYITAIRFYKGPLNTGTHTVNLWAASGANLARATSTSETASGWQEVRFSSPVPISANTQYIASYHTSSGGYAYDGGYFAGRSVTSGPLTAPADSSTAPNGVYRYNSTTTFPNQTWDSANYWVDVVFVTQP